MGYYPRLDARVHRLDVNTDLIEHNVLYQPQLRAYSECRKRRDNAKKSMLYERTGDPLQVGY